MKPYILPAVVISLYSISFLTYILASRFSLNTGWGRDVISITGLAIIYFLLNWSFYVILCVEPMEPPQKYWLRPIEIEEYRHIRTSEGRQLYLYQMTFEKNLDLITRKSTGLIRYCRFCKLIKPDRTHHCAVCGKCILKMDHHCPWLNNCIGFNNYKVFLLASIYALIFFCYFSITLAPVFLDLWDNGDPYYFSVIILTLFAIHFFLGAVITIFLSFHIRFLLNNETYIEHLFPTHFVSKRMTFNIDSVTNFKEVFGDKWQHWLIPTVSCKGDGCTFPYNLIHSDGRTISATSIRSTPSVMSTN